MAVAALIVEFVFQMLGLVPQHRSAEVVETSVTFNYMIVLNIIFVAIVAFLLVRSFRIGGPRMLAHISCHSSNLMKNEVMSTSS